MTDVVILGSTGSIGTQALEVIAGHPEHFRVVGLAAGANADLVAAQAARFDVPRVALADVRAAAALRAEVRPGVQVGAGPGAVTALAGAGADVVLNGITGSRGLAATLAALDAGSRLALANKESLIVGGRLVLDRAGPGQIVPVDSEHSALAQCLRAGAGGEVARLVVTASGGPFRGRTRAELADVTLAEALAHPTWSMGSVITINSATLANKGLEVIEAHLLFGIGYEAIEVVVHPQSVVHSMVEFCDGSTVAALSPPSMAQPIQLALGWPGRLPSAPTRMDWTQALALTFEPLDRDVFGMVDLAVAAGRAGGTAPAVYNAANEEAVGAFSTGRLDFLGICDVVAAVLGEHTSCAATDTDVLDQAQTWARQEAARRIAAHGA